MNLTARLPPLDETELTDEQRAIRDALVAGPRGGVIGPFQIWLRRPELADVADRFGKYCRFRSDGDAKMSELIIMMVASHAKATFEWTHHYGEAIRAGLTEAQLASIERGEQPRDLEEKYAVACGAVAEILRTHRLTALSYARAQAHLGAEGLVDLVGIVGYYLFVSLTLNVFRVGETPAMEGT